MIPIFIQSYKGSKRLAKLKKRFRKLKLNFKIIYGASPFNLKDKNFLNKNYDSNFFFRKTGRNMIAPEIACAYGHLKIYKHIVKHKIHEAIIFEDDICPSKNLKYVLDNYSFRNIDILVFLSTSGYINKNNTFDRLNVHDFISHFNSSCAYRINFKTCNKIIKYTNRRIKGLSDWPLDLLKNNIKCSLLIPLQVMLVDQNLSSAAPLRDALIKFRILKNIFPNYFFHLFRTVYYFLCIPYLLRIYPDFNYYKEYFWKKSFLYIKSLFFLNIIEVKNITSNVMFYQKDLNRSKIKSSLKFLYKTS